jgi:hypothetical protein
MTTRGSGNSLYVIFVVQRDELHCLCKPDLDLDNVVDVAFLSREKYLVRLACHILETPYVEPDVHLPVDVA